MYTTRDRTGDTIIMGKYRFWLSYTNQRGTAAGASLSGDAGVHASGWNAGVRITPRPRLRDEFDVWMTTGSQETSHAVQLGTVKDTPDGPAWEPVVKPGKTPANVMGMEVIAAIPAQSHKNNLDPDAYICVVHSGSYGSGSPYFAAVRAVRNPDGTRWVTSVNRYDLPEMSQTRAVHEMIRLAGCERPACTRAHSRTSASCVTWRAEFDAVYPHLLADSNPVPIDQNISINTEQEN